MMKSLVLLLFVKLIIACHKREYKSGTVCVCNSNYCDEVPKIDVKNGKLQWYLTGASHPGFNVKEVTFTNSKDESANLIELNSKSYQKILGFGGAFTDATGQNIRKLPEAAQRKLLESYFGEDGIEYNVCRVPIGGTDFSPRPYTYDDGEEDIKLERYQLQEEDHNYKIPFIKEAKALRKNAPLRLFGSAWSAPLWMKHNPIWANGFTVLKEEFYEVFANYTLKFFEEYKKKGIDFWGLTTGNEPINGFRLQTVNCMGWTSIDHAKWISNNLGPALKKSKFKDLKVMILDDNLRYLPFYVTQLLNNEKVLPYIDGVATHWYSAGGFVPEIRSLAKSPKKDIFLLNSEASFFGVTPDLGNWTRAKRYIDDIMVNMENDGVGWVDWNMVLNVTGGYTHINKPADAAIIVAKDGHEFFKQPIFYVMGHFSKFVVPDSIRLGIRSPRSDIRVLAFQRPDNLKSVIIFNSGLKDVRIQLKDSSRYSEVIKVPRNSLSTLLYNN